MTEEIKNEQKVDEQDIKELVRKNIELSEEILVLSRKVRSTQVWGNVFGVLKLLIILIPLAIGFLYLPPILKEVMNAYKEALGITDTLNMDFDSIKKNPKELLNDL